jgi:hypothetical protein
MKKLIITALLFAGLTISAQEIDKAYRIEHKKDLKRTYYSPLHVAVFKNTDNASDSIIVYPHICKYKNKEYVIEGFYLVFINEVFDLNEIYFDFDNSKIKLTALKNFEYQKSNKVYFLTCTKNKRPELFTDFINRVKVNDKSYIPEYNSVTYFVYMLGVFGKLKPKWVKEKNIIENVSNFM